ncbi:hypothetical protein ET387_22465, partial [Salmonella enterica]|nr:hypothetical protein [Salmonella enterica]
KQGHNDCWQMNITGIAREGELLSISYAYIDSIKENFHFTPLRIAKGIPCRTNAFRADVLIDIYTMLSKYARKKMRRLL